MSNDHELKRLSDYKIGIWQRCHWKYKLMYHDRLVPKGEKDYAPQLGDIIHIICKSVAMNELDILSPNLDQRIEPLVRQAYPDATDERIEDLIVDSTVLMRGYFNKWYKNGVDDMLHHVASEIHLEREIEGVMLYARIDGLVRTQDERLWRKEIKTSARYDQAYLDGLRKGRQSGIHHLVLEHVTEEKINGTLFDLIVKTKTPQYYRQPVKISKRQRDRALETVLGTIQEIRSSNFYRSYHCFAFNRPCRYLPLCDFPDDPEVQEEHFFVREEDK